MRWAFIELTHYDNDAPLENFEAADYACLTAESLTDAVRQAAAIQDTPLARIDDGDSPYGGVYTRARVARRYDILNDFVKSNTPCYGIFAESVIDLDFEQMPPFN